MHTKQVHLALRCCLHPRNSATCLASFSQESRDYLYAFRVSGPSCNLLICLDFDAMERSPNHSSSSDDEDETMPRQHQSKGRQPRRIVELDLSAVINNEQKLQLQRLVTTIVDEQQKQLHENFDNLTPDRVLHGQGINPPKAICMSIPNPRSEKYRNTYSNSDSIQTTASTSTATPNTKKENVKPTQEVEATTAATLPIWRAPNSPEDLQAMFGMTDVDVLLSSVSELKRDALAHFSKWRGIVLKRIGDIVIKNGGTPGNVCGHQPSTSGTSGPSGNATLPTPARGGMAGPPSGKFFL